MIPPDQIGLCESSELRSSQFRFQQLAAKADAFFSALVIPRTNHRLFRGRYVSLRYSTMTQDWLSTVEQLSRRMLTVYGVSRLADLRAVTRC